MKLDMKLERVEFGMGEDDHEYRIDGKVIARVSYDTHGSAGMRLAREMFEAFAKAANVKIEEFNE